MGLQKSPARTKAKPDASPKPPGSGKQTGPKGSGNGFSRTFGAYFPRSSAQVQPRPPDVSELIRLVEDLRESESRLKTELLEHKLLKESVAILPMLESEISSKDCEIERFRKKIECLEVENELLRNENEFLHMELTNQNQKYEEKIKYMQAELCEIKRAVAEHEETTPSSSSSSPPKLADVTNNYHKSNFSAKVLRKCVTQSNIASNFCDSVASLKKDDLGGTGENAERPRSSRFDSEEIPGTSEAMIAIRSRAPRVPKPPPLPSSSQCSPASLSDSADRALAEISNIPPPPPAKSKVAAPPTPPPPPKGVTAMPPPPPQPPAKSKVAAPPAPPPPPPKGGKSKAALAK
ncbi:formin-G-like, partial [Salvia splendens]|uniref:formin-G-like n=1 Tax=Salvia splendens TaxID=180675 RepID=UPI001C253FA0